MAKTTGTVWLYHSLGSFFGNRNADKSNPIAFLDSYIEHKKKSPDLNAIQLVIDNFPFAKNRAEGLLNRRHEVGITDQDYADELVEEYYRIVRG